MQNDDHSFDHPCANFCACHLCDQPMKLIRRLPQIGGAPELLVFYCRECNEVESAGWQPIATENAAVALN
jgi:hypothetical protein